MLTRLLIVGTFLLPTVGCGKITDAQNRVKASNDLKELALTYHKFVLTEGRPPKSYAELNQKYPMTPECERATVYWGADIIAKDGSSGDTILGHLPNPGGKGVLAMYCDGSVRAITQAEFDAAKKAQPLADKKTDAIKEAKW